MAEWPRTPQHRSRAHGETRVSRAAVRQRSLAPWVAGRPAWRAGPVFEPALQLAARPRTRPPPPHGRTPRQTHSAHTRIPRGPVGAVVMCLVPILFLLLVTLVRRLSLPSRVSLPVSAALMVLIRLAYLSADPREVMSSAIGGCLEALVPLSVVFGAISLFQSMQHTKVRSGGGGPARCLSGGATRICRGTRARRASCCLYERQPPEPPRRDYGPHPHRPTPSSQPSQPSPTHPSLPQCLPFLMFHLKQMSMGCPIAETFLVGWAFACIIEGEAGRRRAREGRERALPGPGGSRRGGAAGGVWAAEHPALDQPSPSNPNGNAPS